MTITYDNDAKRCNFIWCAHNTIEENFPGLTAKKLSEIIGTSMDDECLVYDYDSNDIGLDTCVRDRIMNIVCDYYLGHPWPQYGDNTDMDMFEENLFKAIQNG
jgi:hypothetical protein